MKKTSFKLLITLLMAAGLTFFFSSCSKEPEIPENETLNKDHENPAKAELLLVEGHLHGKYGFHQNPDVEGVKYLKKVQKITYVLTEKGWGATADGLKQFNVRSAMKGADGYAVYGLWINYYNAKGDLITKEFIENGQDLIHQHFFIPREVKPTFDGSVEEKDGNPAELFDYIYCDTDPWNKNMYKEGGKLIGDKNPIGFKGYFKFNKTRKQFDLSIELMHAAKSKFNDGVASPYYEPSRAQRQRDHWDLKIKVPVVIYANQEEYIESDTDTPEDQIPANEMKYLNSIGKAYNISWKEALMDLTVLFNGDVNPESGQLWF